MQAYVLGFDSFEKSGAQILAVSGDNTPSQKKFAESLNVTFPMLSDFKDRKVMDAYGVLIPGQGIANRTTFVIDKDGIITKIIEGSDAIDVSWADKECDRLAHKAASK
jgi:peroxiredoxin